MFSLILFPQSYLDVEILMYSKYVVNRIHGRIILVLEITNFSSSRQDTVRVPLRVKQYPHSKGQASKALGQNFAKNGHKILKADNTYHLPTSARITLHVRF